MEGEKSGGRRECEVGKREIMRKRTKENAASSRHIVIATSLPATAQQARGQELTASTNKTNHNSQQGDQFSKPATETTASTLVNANPPKRTATPDFLNATPPPISASPSAPSPTNSSLAMMNGLMQRLGFASFSGARR